MKLLILAALAAAPAAAQNTWYVDVHAAGPGDGSSASPYQSIQTAMNAPTTGAQDTILVRPGVYLERVRFTHGRPLNIVGVDGPTVTVIRWDGLGWAVDGDFSSSKVEGFTLIKTNGEVVQLTELTLSRCIVIGSPQYGGVRFESGVIDHCLVSNCLYGLGIALYSSGVVKSSILAENVLPLAIQSAWGGGGLVQFQHCVVDHLIGNEPTTNIDLPPLFRSATGRDFHLRSTSPCIDAGDPNDPLDPDGSTSDIGPIPFDPNYAPNTVYCTAKVNSQGCTPAIEALGTASSTAAAPFEISCANELNQRSGLLFYGFAPHDIPFQGGHLCVHAPVQRTPLLSSGGSTTGDDCSGVYVYDFNARVQSGADPLLEPGREVFAQFWSRDPSASFNSNRSDALRFRVQP